MILTCPACATRYVVKDGAIPAGGRQVRCASCKESWHQDPEGLGEGDSLAPAVVEPAQAPRETETFTEAETASEPREESEDEAVSSDAGASARLGDHAHPDVSSGAFGRALPVDPDASPLPESGASSFVEPVSEPGLVQEAVHEPELVRPPEPQTISADPSPPATDPAFEEAPLDPQEQFAAYARYRDDEQPAGRRGLVGVLIALLLIAALVAGFWFLAPAEWKQRLGIAQGSGTPLLVQVDERNRRTLASGNQLLEVSGKVINPTDSAQRVPPLQAQLRSLEQKIVYRWTIPPPAATLAPGGSASFNSAELNIPADAACLDVSFGDVAGERPAEPCRASADGSAVRPS